MKEIGGYLGLECNNGSRYHENAYLLNSGTSALRLSVRSYGIRQMHVPEFTCPTVWKALEKEGCKLLFYKVGFDFLPQKDFPKNDYILYNNYFGMCSKQVHFLENLYPNLLVDNAQAFFMNPLGIVSFYSPRKFFGLPDGGMLFSKKKIELPAQRSVSWNGCAHLLKRIDEGGCSAYDLFKKNEERICREDILRMSFLTEVMMKNIDYQYCKKKRLQNFHILHELLKGKNKLPICLSDEDIPMVYPFLASNKSLRDQLIAKKIYVPFYWPGNPQNCFGQLLPLPIDQRYSSQDMQYVAKLVGDL